MSPANHRHERVGEEIAHEINALLVGELKDPRLEGMVVASEVRVQPDMKHARVFINVKGTNKEQSDAIKALEHASGYIRRELVERLQLRRVPELPRNRACSGEWRHRRRRRASGRSTAWAQAEVRGKCSWCARPNHSLRRLPIPKHPCKGFSRLRKCIALRPKPPFLLCLACFTWEITSAKRSGGGPHGNDNER